GPMSSNSLAVASLSPRYASTCRWLWRPPLRALVISFSAIGRSALALASVVTIAPVRDSSSGGWWLSTNEVTMFAIIKRWCAASPPKRRPFFGAPGTSHAPAASQRQAALVELDDHLVERLLPEVGERQQIVGRALHELADGVDLAALQA